jgi:hypothetical protein
MQNETLIEVQSCGCGAVKMANGHRINQPCIAPAPVQTPEGKHAIGCPNAEKDIPPGMVCTSYQCLPTPEGEPLVDKEWRREQMFLFMESKKGFKNIIDEAIANERQRILAMLTAKRDRYTTEGDPRWGIINSDIESVQQME